MTASGRFGLQLRVSVSAEGNHFHLVRKYRLGEDRRRVSTAEQRIATVQPMPIRTFGTWRSLRWIRPSVCRGPETRRGQSSGKTPHTPVTYVCDWNHNTNELVWHVIYGAISRSSEVDGGINASTGTFIRVEK